MVPVTLRKRTSWLVRALPPTAPRPRQIPGAVFRAALFGVIIGPVLGVFFGWSGPLRAAMVGGTYCVVFYTLCALPVGYTREHFAEKLPRRAIAAVVVTNLAGIAAASLVMLVLFEGFRLQLQDLQIPIVMAMFALAWGYLITERQFADAEGKLANSRAYTRVLQSRMNPHFFFNTLNTIAALIPEDQAAAQRMLGLMADMSRYVFTGVDSEVASLRDELEFARGYLEIERVRFGGRLQCTLPSDSEVGDIVIPIFTLQPLIENAVRHGIGKRIGGGVIAVELIRSGAQFTLTVENDVEDSAVSEADFFKSGHALDNIRERLLSIYRGQASMKVTFPQPNLVSVRIEAPGRPKQNGSHSHDPVHPRR
jgi:LytS/YehU family sensor histidine kinase